MIQQQKLIRAKKIQALKEFEQGNIQPLIDLDNNIETPMFIWFHIENGLYHLQWQDKVFTKDQFEDFKTKQKQTIFYREVCDDDA